MVRAEKISTTPPQNGRFWGCRNFCKTAFFGLISAVFDSGGPIWSQNGLGGTKNFLRELWNPFGAYQENFDHPTPNRSFWGLQKFQPTQRGPFLVKNKFFDQFFELVKGHIYSDHTLAEWSLCVRNAQLCVLRVQGHSTSSLETIYRSSKNGPIRPISTS